MLEQNKSVFEDNHKSCNISVRTLISQFQIQSKVTEQIISSENFSQTFISLSLNEVSLGLKALHFFLKKFRLVAQSVLAWSCPISWSDQVWAGKNSRELSTFKIMTTLSVRSSTDICSLLPYRLTYLNRGRKSKRLSWTG